MEQRKRVKELEKGMLQKYGPILRKSELFMKEYFKFS